MNPPAFPDDDNGDVLRRMAEAGDNLDVAREIDFCVIFPTESAALECAVALLRMDLKVSFSNDECDEQLPWLVQAHPHMHPTHEAITAFESMVGGVAAQFGGRNDGWGCMAQ